MEEELHNALYLYPTATTKATELITRRNLRWQNRWSPLWAAPNVGKSMLFNKLVGRRLSIVEDTPGVTRDRIYAPCEWRNRVFDIVDTGGIEPGTDDQILAFMREQAEIAISTATVIV